MCMMKLAGNYPMLMRARCRIGLINRYFICFDPREAKLTRIAQTLRGISHFDCVYPAPEPNGTLARCSSHRLIMVPRPRVSASCGVVTGLSCSGALLFLSAVVCGLSVCTSIRSLRARGRRFHPSGSACSLFCGLARLSIRQDATVWASLLHEPHTCPSPRRRHLPRSCGETPYPSFIL